jgi:hypothetical protein
VFKRHGGWLLEPLLSASEGQRRDLDKLQDAVQTCLANDAPTHDPVADQITACHGSSGQGPREAARSIKPMSRTIDLLRT